MSTILAAQNGNWHDGATWTGGVVPGPGDVAVLNGKAIAITQDVTCSEIRSDATGGATQGGTATVSTGGLTITANLLLAGSVSGTPDLIVFDAVAPASLTVMAAALQGTTPASTYPCAVLRNQSTGTINITGNITGSASNRGVVRNAVSGTINVTGNVTPGPNGSVYTYGIHNVSTGAISVIGNVVGGSTQSGVAIYNASSGTVTVSGDVTGGSHSTAYGIQNTAAGIVTINGLAISGAAPAVLSDASGSLVTLRGAVCNESGVFPVAGGRPVRFDRSAAVQVTFRDTNSNEFTLYEPADLPTYPAASNVKTGTVYGPDNTLTGTCAVPPAESVAFGVPTGSDTGTLQLDPAELALAVWAASTRSLTDKDGFAPSAVDNAAAVWSAEVRALTDKAGFGATPGEVWSHESRTLTSESGGSGASAEEIWTHPQRTLTEMPLTAADVWQYQDRVITEAPAIEGVLGDVWESVAGIQGRIAEQVTSGPVVVVPSPAEGQTTAWCMCYRGDGTLASNIPVEIWIEGAGKGGHGLFSSERRTVTADESGILSFAIPRNTLLRFALQAANGQKVSFQGVDADTLELPIIIA